MVVVWLQTASIVGTGLFTDAINAQYIQGPMGTNDSKRTHASLTKYRAHMNADFVIGAHIYTGVITPVYWSVMAMNPSRRGDYPSFPDDFETVAIWEFEMNPEIRNGSMAIN